MGLMGERSRFWRNFEAMKRVGVTRRGVGLATTLGFTGAIVLLAFVCVAACFAQLTLSTRGQRLSEAELAADAVTQLAGARLLDDATFGNRGNGPEKSLEVRLPQGTARLTFDPETARLWGIPVSRNNLAGEEPVSGFGRTLPAQSVQLLAQGQSGGRMRVLEVILNQPPFQWAIASTGQIHSTGGLQVMGVKDFSMLQNGLAHLPPEQILPGHLVSDHSSAEALVLDSSSASPTLITGDAQARGGISVGPSTTVRGKVKQHAESARLPELVVENYDPAGMQGLQELGQANLGSQLSVSGVTRREGNLTVQQGGLALDEGYLYVHGNLEIFGGLSGKGAIFATGNVTVHGVSQFATENLQAIVAKGDLNLYGSGAEASSFQGLLMAGGGQLKARQVTLVGSFLGTSREGAGSSVELDQVQLVSSPQAIHLDFPNLMMERPTSSEVLVAEGSGVTRNRVWPVLDPHLDVTRFYDPVADRLDPSLVTAESLKPWYLCEDGYLNRDLGQVAGHLRHYTLDNSNQPRMVTVEGVEGNPDIAALNEQQAGERLRAGYQSALRRADVLYQQARQNGLPRGQFSLDPNAFIQSSDKMRRLLWRVVE